MPHHRESPRDHVPLLTPLFGGTDKKPRVLDKDAMTLGRARGCDITLDANEVSAIHCIFYRAPVGIRVRDCGSRTGTRVNGNPVRNLQLCDGDILQIGPFSFALKLPAELANPPAVDARHLDRANRSRRNVVRLALAYRRRARGLGPDTNELHDKAAELKAKIRTYDERACQLEASEAELVAEREQLEKDKEAHRCHVQQVETELAARLAHSEEQIHTQWAEFQKHCAVEEARLLKLEGRTGTGSAHESIQREREELSRLRAQWAAEQVQARADADQRLASVAQAEAGLGEKKAELSRMFGELRRIQDELRKQPRGDYKPLQLENEQLRQKVYDLEKRLAQAELTRAVSSDSDETTALRAENQTLHELLQQRLLRSEQGEAGAQELQAENEQLRRQLGEYEERRAGGNTADAIAQLQEAKARTQVQQLELERLRDEIVRLQKEVQDTARPAASQAARNQNDLESYEAELNRYRQQLEADRAKLTKEIESLRARNAELDEATRETEMELSRERAELARERTRLDRLRDEVKVETERLQRDGGVRESLAGVQRLRDEMRSTGGRR